MTDGTINYPEHSYKGGQEEHWRVYGNEGEMINMDQVMGAPGANENLAEDLEIEAMEREANE